MGRVVPLGTALPLIGVVLWAVRVTGLSRRLAGEGHTGLGLTENHQKKQEQPARHVPHAAKPNRPAGQDRETLMRPPSYRCLAVGARASLRLCSPKVAFGRLTRCGVGDARTWQP
jgi:hypothetical protein